MHALRPYFTSPPPIHSETVWPKLSLLGESGWVPRPDAPVKRDAAGGRDLTGGIIAFLRVLGRSLPVNWDLSCP